MNVNTQLIDAAGMGNVAGVESALRSGANVNHQGDMGMTALINAAMRGRVEVVRLLLARGADRQASDALGMTAADYAGNFPDVAALL